MSLTAWLITCWMGFSWTDDISYNSHPYVAMGPAHVVPAEIIISAECVFESGMSHYVVSIGFPFIPFLNYGIQV